MLLGLNAAQGPDKDQVVALGLIAVSLVLFVILTFVERRTDNAILDGKLLRLPAFLCSCVASFLLGFVFFLFLFITAVYLQERLGYNALTSGDRARAAQSRPRRNRSHVRTPNESVSVNDSADHKLRFSGLRAGGPFVHACILRIYWNGASVSACCRWRRSRIYFAEHRWPGCDFCRAFRPGYGNDLYVSVCWRRDRSRRRQCTSQRDLSHQLVFRLSETPLSFAQQKLLEQPGAAERIRQIDSGLVASQVEQVRQAFYESFVAAFTGTLRLNVIVPIAIAILTMVLMRKKEGTKQTPSMDAGR